MCSGPVQSSKTVRRTVRRLTSKSFGSKSRDAIKEYVAEQEAHHREALGLDDLVKMAENEIQEAKS